MGGISVLVIAALGAFAATALSIQLLRPLSLRIGWVDAPNARKTHAGAVPLSGGLAMYVVFAAVVLMLGLASPGLNTLLLGAGLLTVDRLDR